MSASDHPHWDSEFPGSIRPLRKRSDLDPAGRFFGLG